MTILADISTVFVYMQ